VRFMVGGATMTLSVFLSASVPLPPPHRHEKYFGTADQIAIRDSIRALVSAVVPRGTLVFGGHPAITPLIRLLVLESGASVGEHIFLFQSRLFEKQFPPEVLTFENLNLVDAVGQNREASLAAMREKMLGSQDFTAGVFIGGMEGVEEEYRMFQKMHPTKPAYPIASTGAAALILFEREKSERRELLEDLRYLSLFRRLLQIPV
jgi:SLOG cluster3 family